METKNVALDFANSKFRNSPVESDCGLRTAGRYVCRCWIAGKVLVEGSLAADVAITTFFEVHFHEQSVVGFDVTDSIDGDAVRGDYAGHLPGVVRPLFEWKTGFEPYGSERQVANEAIRG